MQITGRKVQTFADYMHLRNIVRVSRVSFIGLSLVEKSPSTAFFLLSLENFRSRYKNRLSIVIQFTFKCNKGSTLQYHNSAKGLRYLYRRSTITNRIKFLLICRFGRLNKDNDKYERISCFFVELSVCGDRKRESTLILHAVYCYEFEMRS